MGLLTCGRQLDRLADEDLRRLPGTRGKRANSCACARQALLQLPAASWPK